VSPRSKVPGRSGAALSDTATLNVALLPVAVPEMRPAVQHQAAERRVGDHRYPPVPPVAVAADRKLTLSCGRERL
jgi:hypothetical protein